MRLTRRYGITLIPLCVLHFDQRKSERLYALILEMRNGEAGESYHLVT
jgi:hypothetical protein